MKNSFMKIGEALPNIFKRTYPVLEHGTQMLLAVSLLRFHQIDALPIGFDPLDRKRIAVLGYSCLSKLLETDPKDYGKFLEMPCEKAAIELATIDIDDEIESLLHVFNKTRFGFAWVESESLGAFATLRDLLELYKKGIINTNMRTGEVASPVFSLPKETKIKKVLEEMLSHRFRRVFISGEDNLVTDRRIISYIFSASRLSKTAKRPEILLDARLGSLEKMEAVSIGEATNIKAAVSAMKDASEDCLICGKGVITPWDLVMKPLAKGRLRVTK